jgi:hypothetical protein
MGRLKQKLWLFHLPFPFLKLTNYDLLIKKISI